MIIGTYSLCHSSFISFHFNNDCICEVKSFLSMRINLFKSFSGLFNLKCLKSRKSLKRITVSLPKDTNTSTFFTSLKHCISPNTADGALRELFDWCYKWYARTYQKQFFHCNVMWVVTHCTALVNPRHQSVWWHHQVRTDDWVRLSVWLSGYCAPQTNNYNIYAKRSQ